MDSGALHVLSPLTQMNSLTDHTSASSDPWPASVLGVVAGSPHPCIVLTGPADLASGASAALLRDWALDNRHTVLITQPRFAGRELINSALHQASPLQPPRLVVLPCVLHSDLTLVHAQQLMALCKPKQVLLPSSCIAGYSQIGTAERTGDQACQQTDSAGSSHLMGQVMPAPVIHGASSLTPEARIALDRLPCDGVILSDNQAASICLLPVQRALAEHPR